MNLIEAGKAFIRAFPTRARWRSYLAWEQDQQREKKRQKQIARQIRERRADMIMMTDDGDDEDFEPMTPEIWDKLKHKD